MSDPLTLLVVAQFVGWDGHEREIIRDDSNTDRASVVFQNGEGERALDQVWIQSDGQWQIDVCIPTFDSLGEGLALTGEQTEEGLVARVQAISAALNDEEVGTYQWLSTRCRADLFAEYEEYGFIFLFPSDGFSSVVPADVEVLSVQGQTGFTSPVSNFASSTPGHDRDRWTFENGNWFYDACLTQDEAWDRDEQQVEIVKRAHPALVDVDAPGMTASGFYTTDSNQLVYRFDLVEQPDWPWVQQEYIERLWPEILEAAGYEILEARAQRVDAVLRDDSMATVDVRLESTYVDTYLEEDRYRHTFWLTLSYR